jgi:DNA helicase HerA-like ATPase
MADSMESGIERLFEKLRCIPEIRERIEMLRQAYILDYKMRPEIEQIVYGLADKYKDKLILEPPSKEQSKGDLYIGEVFCERELYPFYLRTSELTRHMAIYGSSGSGKTILVDRIASERLKTGEPILIFDWDSSHLHLLKRPEAKALRYYSVGSHLSPLYFNPFLVPDDFSMDERATFFTSLLNSLVERHLPGSSVTKRSIKIYLRKILIEQFLSKGIKSFSFADLQKAASYKRSYISVEDFLSQFVYGPLGRVLNSNPEEQISIETLFSQQSLIDLGHLINPEERADFVDLLLSYAYEVFLKRGKVPYVDNTLRIMLIIEEVHGLFHQHENIISSFFREFRKWGGGLIITDQNPSAIPRFVRGNTFYTVVLHLGSKEDIEIMSRAMMLNGEERHYLTMIQSGKGIGIMKMQSRFTSPFLIKIAALEKQGNSQNELNVQA